MKKLIFIYLLILSTSSFGQSYTPLNSEDPVFFNKTNITYRGDTIQLNEKALYIDGQLSDEEAEQYPFVFNSFNKAIESLKDGSEDAPMTVYIAPYVYWLDNPDDLSIRKPLAGHNTPFALTINCPWLKIYGLTQNPENVVLAVNKGQSQGADGNFTMINYIGDGLQLHNLTLGNYCNIDLNYPLKPDLNKSRRLNTVTQAQLLFVAGDKGQAHNVHFLSRLNLCPMSGAKRALFNQCYFEMTDDALCESGVYLSCAFTFYGSKPFYSTQPFGGAVFLDCDFQVKTANKQYMVKSGGPVTLIDSRYHSEHPIYIGWHQEPSLERRFYQSNVTLNEEPIIVDSMNREVTVDITRKPIINAYKVLFNNKTIYNTYNLLAGNDDWDPMKIKDDILAAQNHLGVKLTKLPTHLSIMSTADSVQTGEKGCVISTSARMFGNYDACTPPLSWEYNKSLFKLADDNDQKVLYSINESDSTQASVVCITSGYGLEAAKIIAAEPKMMEPPAFTTYPRIELDPLNHKLSLDYQLDLQNKTDKSIVSWYRCTSAQGDNPIEVKVTRLNNIVKEYPLSLNDVGYYMMVQITPKHICSKEGDATQVIWNKKIEVADVSESYSYESNFIDFSEKQQPQIIPGFWTVDGYKPNDTSYYTNWEANTIQNWQYGEGFDGAKGISGLYQTARGARLMFTPINKNYGDMNLNLTVAPCKQIGQGFGSATGQYMDVCIKFDTSTLTGYGLRIIRTTKHHNAVDFYLVKYSNGETKQISEALTGICFLPTCTINIKAKGNQLSAEVHTNAKMRETDDITLHKTINLEAMMDEPSSFGGVAIQHTGSGWGGATLLRAIKVDWE